MRSWIGRKFAHHRRTKRRLNQWVTCHGIQTRGFLLARLFWTLRRGASRGYAVGFLQCPFGTRGSRVQILSPRPTQGREFRGFPAGSRPALFVTSAFWDTGGKPERNPSGVHYLQASRGARAVKGTP